MNKEKKNKIIMTIIIGGVCLILFAVMFMQFRTIEETDITAIENMREAELRTAISEWKGKYEETVEQLQANQKTIKDYKNKLEKNEEASGLVDKELKDSNMILGKTDVFGEGVTITLSNSEERDVKYRDLLELINELRYAGAEAISINDVRILSSTEIAQPDGVLMIINGQRVSSPYVIKAIGNQTYLSSTLSLKDSGYIDKTRAIGLNVKLETGKNIKILKYNGDMNIKYMKEGGKQVMIFIAIVIGCILGAVIGIYAPIVPYTYSGYLAIAIIAALDSVFGGISSTLKKNFDLKIFVTGFFGNAILSILLTYLGQKLNVDIYLAAIVVFVGRMFNNLAIIRRYYLERWNEKMANKNNVS